MVGQSSWPVWVHIEGIRRWTVDLEVDNPKYDEYIQDMSSKMGSRFGEGSEKYKVQKWTKKGGIGIWMPGTKKLG